VPLAPGSALRGRIVLGVRPHDLRVGGGPGISGRVQVVERLGTETNVVVGIDAPRLRARALSDAIDAGPDDDVLLAEDDRASFTVVLEARTSVAVGDTVELTVDPQRLHGFDIETGEALGAPAPASKAVPV
jgi:multiple sugar transport system ATP-binding protein